MIVRQRSRCVAPLVALVALACWPSAAVGAPVLYSTQAAFEAALSAAPSVIDFESATAGEALTTQIPGITFGPANGGNPYAGTFTPRSGAHALLTVGVTHGGGGFVADFASPVEGFAFYIGGLQYERTTLEIFGSGGQSLGILDLADMTGNTFNYSGYVFGGVTADAPIASIRVQIYRNDFVWFDDFLMGPTDGSAGTLPEPGLVSLAAGATLIARRRLGAAR